MLDSCLQSIVEGKLAGFRIGIANSEPQQGRKSQYIDTVTAWKQLILCFQNNGIQQKMAN